MNATKCNCSKCKPWNQLDRLISRVTAFNSWEELTAAMGTTRNQKYAPTLNGNGAEKRLAEIIRANGYKVFRKGLVA